MKRFRTWLPTFRAPSLSPSPWMPSLRFGYALVKVQAIPRRIRVQKGQRKVEVKSYSNIFSRGVFHYGNRMPRVLLFSSGIRAEKTPLQVDTIRKEIRAIGITSISKMSDDGKTGDLMSHITWYCFREMILVHNMRPVGHLQACSRGSQSYPWYVSNYELSESLGISIG